MTKNKPTPEELPDETKYIVTPKQIAKIVTYCINMTVAGHNNRKDWLPNVLTAIDGVNGTEYMTTKVKLQTLANWKELKSKLSNKNEN